MAQQETDEAGRMAGRNGNPFYFRWIDGGLEAVCGFLLVEIVVLLFANVIARYVFVVPLHWADEVVRYSFTWLCFLSGALVMRFAGHMAMDMFTDAFPAPVARTIRIVVETAVVIFLAVLVVYSWQMAQIAGGQKSSTLRISMMWVYLAAPVGSAFMLFYSLRRLVGYLRGSDTIRLDERDVAQ